MTIFKNCNNINHNDLMNDGWEFRGDHYEKTYKERLLNINLNLLSSKEIENIWMLKVNISTLNTQPISLFYTVKTMNEIYDRVDRAISEYEFYF